jgi:hypothetical protein
MGETRKTMYFGVVDRVRHRNTSDHVPNHTTHKHFLEHSASTPQWIHFGPFAFGAIGVPLSTLSIRLMARGLNVELSSVYCLFWTTWLYTHSRGILWPQLLPELSKT